MRLPNAVARREFVLFAANAFRSSPLILDGGGDELSHAMARGGGPWRRLHRMRPESRGALGRLSSIAWMPHRAVARRSPPTPRGKRARRHRRGEAPSKRAPRQ